MAEQIKYAAKIVQMSWVTSDIASMWLEYPEAAQIAVPGQFAMLYCNDNSHLLPRPISICDIDRERGLMRFVFRIAGAGTREFAEKKAGDLISVIAPLGNGFKFSKSQSPVIVGGGIGIFPLLYLAKSIQVSKKVVIGYRSEPFFTDEFIESGAELYIATEDGCKGTKGNVIDCIRENKISGDIYFACGPMPMLRGLKEYTLDSGSETQLSLEERMACGIGVCLGCVVRSVSLDDHSHVNNKRVCKDGPVFDASQVEL